MTAQPVALYARPQSGSRRERLSGADAAWLQMDAPTNPMVITAVLGFDALPSFHDIERLVVRHLLAHERFRQRVVRGWLPPHAPAWKRDPRFVLGAHLHHVALPPPGDDAALRDFVSARMSAPLERSRPLWEALLVEQRDGGGALVVRVHHCLADGVALVRLLEELAEVPEHALGGAPARAHTAPRARGPLRMGGALVASLARLLRSPADPRTSLAGELGTTKRAAWTEPIPLAEVKRAGRAAGATVNDVLMAAVAGALRAYLRERGEATDRTLHAVVPVDLRGPGAAPLGNDFGLVFLPLPLDAPDAPARLRAVKATMDAIKRSPDAAATLGLLGIAGHAGAGVERAMVEIFGHKGSLVVTNVRGPERPLAIAGRPLRSLVAWVPQSGHLGLGVSLVSYAGAVTVGVASDAHRVRDPEALVHAVRDEIRALAATAEVR